MAKHNRETSTAELRVFRIQSRETGMKQLWFIMMTIFLS